MYTVTFLPSGVSVEVEAGTSLLSAEVMAGLHPDAPCGGNGTCGKCRVMLDGQEVLACETAVNRDMTVQLPEQSKAEILVDGIGKQLAADGQHEYVVAFDIGTTTLVGFLLNGKTGDILASASTMNPQAQYGADVISRIQTAITEDSSLLRQCITDALGKLILELADKTKIDTTQITLVCVVGNTAMHHLFLGIDPSSLITPPYMPTISHAIEEPVNGRLPIAGTGILRVLPNIAGFVGADTVGCMVSTGFDALQELTLLIDIGTNGEMVLANRDRRIACSTAAGPAFEGAKISQGMRGAAGAVDHVWLKNGDLHFHVIGESDPIGICGSGLLDLVAALLDAEIIDESGRLEDKLYILSGTTVSLTQKDVREVQLAKGAIRAGIELMCREMGVQPEDIKTVLLAGAFGNYMDPKSACRIGMIPPCLVDRIRPVGNAAGEGAKLCAVNCAEFERAKQLAEKTDFLELASLPDFQDRFVDALEFCEDE